MTRGTILPGKRGLTTIKVEGKRKTQRGTQETKERRVNTQSVPGEGEPGDCSGRKWFSVHHRM